MLHTEKNKVQGGTLYLVATPIGNLADMSSRAIKVLSEADFIAAEDTRNTLRLLSSLGISAELVSYHEHNKREAGERILSRLAAGESCALVTDAGTPAISDPGADLVCLCADAGIPVTTVPGACALITALTLSGLDTTRFVFEGFLPVKSKERKIRINDIAAEARTVILHEAPHKLRTTLDDLGAALGADRKISLCRELTKLNEEIMRTTIGEAIAYYAEREPRGEYVLVIEGRSNSDDAAPDMTPEEAVAFYEEQGMDKKDAIKSAAKLLGVPKNEIYNRIMKK